MRKKVSILIWGLLLIFGIYKCNSQSFEYINFSADANKLFHLKDNSRTVNDVYGLDYDVEVGAKDGHFGVFMFYGEFKKAFRNYGAGVDYYPFKRIDGSIGVAYSVVKERDFRDNYVGVGWVAFRGVYTYWFGHFGVSGRLQMQHRSDVSKGYIIEGAAGISLRL